MYCIIIKNDERTLIMISDIAIDFNKMKAILIDVIAKNEKLISTDRKEILQYLYDEYEPKCDIIESNIGNYEVLLAEFYRQKIENMATYCSNDTEKFNRKTVQELENTGKIFSKSIFHIFVKHLYLEMNLDNKNYQFEIDVIKKLCYHIGNTYYFNFEETYLQELFEYAIKLHLCDTPIFDTKDIETTNILKSMKNLLKIRDFEYDVKYGYIYFSDDAEKNIQLEIEHCISKLGGIAFLRKLFNEEIKPKYNHTIDRFLIHRNIQQVARNIRNLRIPYNYLIQLSVKHLNAASCILLTETGIRNEYNKAIQISRDYLNVLNLQSYLIFGDIIYDFKSIPVKLSRNILFEKLYTPIQYRPDFTLKFLQDVYSPLFNKSTNYGYSFKEYINFCNKILSERSYCATYSFEELSRLTNIKRSALTRILDDVSYNYNEVNSNFNHFLSETNYRLRPLVKLKNEKYFLFSAYFNGFAFSEVLYKKLKPDYPGNFNRKKGKHVEAMIKNLFKEKGYTYHSGNYTISKGHNDECDMVIETADKIIFIEIKNQPLPDSFEQGDDIKTLRCLGEGMIESQIQCCKHIKQLKNKGYIIFEGENQPTYKLNYNNRRIICISICSQEYLFLTNKMFSENFLESMLCTTYHAFDSNKENRLKNLNELREKLVALVSNIYGNAGANKVFFDTLFRSAQQISTILNASNTLEDFVENLTTPIYISDGSNDVYCQLTNRIK